MPNPVADIAVILPLVYDELNTATQTYGTWSESANGNNPRWQELAIKNWCVEADLEIQRAICETADSPYRNYFVQAPATIAASGDALPAAVVGPIQAVFVTGADASVRPARPSPTTWLGYYNNDPQGVFGPAGATDFTYSQLDGRLYFKGASAQVYFCTVTRATTAALLVPPAFTNTIVKAACGFACAKESDFLQESQDFLKQFYGDLDLIRRGASAVPPVQQTQIAGV